MHAYYSSKHPYGIELQLVMVLPPPTFTEIAEHNM